jgi:hypothetical protein
MRRALLVLIAVAAAAAVPAAAAADPLSRALALERQGRVDRALALLDAQPKLSAAARTHRTHLADAVAALVASRSYVAVQDFAAAHGALEAAAKPLDPLREAALLTLVRTREATVAGIARAPADAAARASLAKARTLAKAGKHAEAAAVDKAVADLPAGEISDPLRTGARQAQLAQEAAAATEGGPSVVDRVRDGLRTALVWLAYAGIGLAAFVVLVLGRRALTRLPPKEEISISIEDVSAATAERSQKSYALTREVVAHVRGVAAAARGEDEELDETRDLDGTSLPNLHVVGSGLAQLDAIVHDETPLKVGPLSFSPRQILFAVAPFLRRRSTTEFVGALVEEGDRISLTLEWYRNGDRRKPRDAWHVAKSGTGARADAVAEIAARIVAAVGDSAVSSSWRSLAEYRQATAKLVLAPDADDPRKLLQEARTGLRRSLEYDQGNLIARFNLARVERQLGEDEAAAQHFKFIDEFARVAEKAAAETVPAAFAHQHPELRFVARYNRAAALTKLTTWEAHKEALGLLDALGDELDRSASSLTDEQRVRLSLLVTGTRAATAVFELEQLHRSDSDAGVVGRRAACVAEIQASLDRLEKAGDDASLRGDRAWVRSCALAQNAYGRALFYTSRPAEAVAHHQEAVDMIPDLLDAQLNLAEAVMKAKQPKQGWASRARAALDSALALAPDNQRALFLSGHVWRALGRNAEAKAAFEKVAENPWAAFELGSILASEGSFEEAAEHAERSVYLARRPDVRHEKLVDWVLEAGEPGPVASYLVDVALKAADALRTANPDKRDYWSQKIGELNKVRRSQPVRAQAARATAG